VRTEEAIEATVCVEARALRRDWKSFSTFSCCAISTSCQSASDIGLLFPFKQYFHTTNVRMAMNATPPMTPPAIAPTFGLLGAESPAVGSNWHCTEAHWLHVLAICTQIWFVGHVMPSQDRGACSQTPQRLSSRKTRSASEAILAFSYDHLKSGISYL
jgi:hypothetical protein